MPWTGKLNTLWVFIAILLIGFGLGAFYFFHRSVGQVACTDEAKQCPDGSYVGRTGPNCEFAPCPQIQQNGMSAGTNVPSAPASTTTNTVNVSLSKYVNNQYGFEFSYPSFYGAYETSWKNSPTTRLSSSGVAAPEEWYNLILSTVDETDPNYDFTSDNSYITLSEEGGYALYGSPITIQNHWNHINVPKLTYDQWGHPSQTKLVKIGNSGGIDFVLWQQLESDSDGSTYWVSRAEFLADGRFFSIGGNVATQTLESILDSFKLIPASLAVPKYISGQPVL